MKHTFLSLSPSDIDAITCALSVIPSYENIDDCAEFILPRAFNTLQKVLSHEALNKQDTQTICFAVDAAQQALRGEIYLEEEALTDLRKYLFIINKLFSEIRPGSYGLPVSE